MTRATEILVFTEERIFGWDYSLVKIGMRTGIQGS